ncbi:hypothetical protein [Yoonia sp. R78084]|uniref:hypothetical protein n=1 Tax=Yoonia sp. R78084 TaxID=3093869 RepID=UPI0037DC406B
MTVRLVLGFAPHPIAPTDKSKGRSIDTSLILFHTPSMFKRDAPEDVHSRLNREMWRMRLGGWKGLLGTAVIMLVVSYVFIRIPVATTFKIAEVTGTMAHMTEDHPRLQIGIIIDGQHRSATTRAMLLHPAKAEIVCIRETTYWPLGQVTLSLTDDHFCE